MRPHVREAHPGPGKRPGARRVALAPMSTSEPGPLTEHAAVVHGDVAGYSRLIAGNEIETHQTLQVFRRIIEEAVAEETGKVATFVGDEFLAVLPTRPGGLAAAIAIQRALAGENERLPAGRRMRFRLGVNYGPVSVEDGRWFGDVINVAARLQAIAKPGGICVSAAALECTEDIRARFRSLGRQRLKNIPEPILAYEIVDDELPGKQRGRGREGFRSGNGPPSP